VTTIKSSRSIDNQIGSGHWVKDLWVWVVIGTGGMSPPSISNNLFFSVHFGTAKTFYSL